MKVSLTAGEVNFLNPGAVADDELKKGIGLLGYRVPESGAEGESSNPLVRALIICIPFTLVLMLHPLYHLLGWHFMNNGWLQLALSLPVLITGLIHFAPGAWMSITQGKPNMNVLIVLGAVAAFGYSVAGTLAGKGENFLFYETAAAIFTIVLAGNWLEDRTLKQTQRSLESLVSKRDITAQMIAFDDQHQEIIFPVDSRTLRSGDLIMIRSGEQVPGDAKILWGEGQLDESIVTGESLPVIKKAKDLLIGGSLLIDGSLKAQVTTDQAGSVLGRMIGMVKKAQAEKPAVQDLADRISAIFVPAVIGIAIVTFFLNWFWMHDATEAVMRAVAVLVIACPCALGLATPAAIAVGLGRGARKGILFRHADDMETFREIKQVVFDKTGTLTTGSFAIRGFGITDPALDEQSFKEIVYSLETHSMHPLAAAIVKAWKPEGGRTRWRKVEEIKGSGLRGLDADGNRFLLGSVRFAGLPNDRGRASEAHDLVLQRNGVIAGWIDLQDEVRPEAIKVIAWFRRRGIKTFLLSGDREAKCRLVGDALGIDEVYAEQNPDQKAALVARWNGQAPTAMVGDGINDAPALAKARLGISMSSASQLAMQTAGVVLINSGLTRLTEAFELGKQTWLTIRQNLFWAFIYNIIAIPVAASGWLTPAIGALAMGLSDVVLLVNSTRLFVKKLDYI